MGRRLFLIFNHKITLLQAEDARKSLQVEQIVDLPDELKPVWNQIPPNLVGIAEYLSPIKSWLDEHAVKGDRVLIQGDFGACFILVNHAFELGLVPIYSTSEREAKEEQCPDGSVRLTHRFEHRTFRRYGV